MKKKDYFNLNMKRCIDIALLVLSQKDKESRLEVVLDLVSNSNGCPTSALHPCIHVRTIGTLAKSEPECWVIAIKERMDNCVTHTWSRRYIRGGRIDFGIFIEFTIGRQRGRGLFIEFGAG